MALSTNVCKPKIIGFANRGPTFIQKYVCDDLRDKDPKIVTVNFLLNDDQITKSGGEIKSQPSPLKN